MHRWEPRVTFRRRIVKQGNSLPVWIWKSAGFFALLVGLPAWSQQASPPPAQQTESLTTAVHELQDQVRELRAAVVEVRSEAAQYRAETAELRKELQVTRSQLVSSGVPSQPNSYAGPSHLGDTGKRVQFQRCSWRQPPPIGARTGGLRSSPGRGAHVGKSASGLLRRIS